MRTLIFWLNDRKQKKEKMKEDDTLLSNSRVQIKEINQWGQ